MGEHAFGEDPHTELTAEILGQLSAEGEYVVELDPHPQQRLIDLRWAAHRAGRMLGRRTRMVVSGATNRRRPFVRVTVTCLDELGRAVTAGYDAARGRERNAG